MSGKSRTVARLESEIEKSRAESNWAKAADLAKQLTEKSSSLGSFTALVVAEGKLERHLLENPPEEKNAQKARDSMWEVKKQLTDLSRADVKPSWKTEASLLLSKMQYAMGQYAPALETLDELGLENLQVTKASVRFMRIVAEAFAIKGLCLEKTSAQSTSKFRQAEREEQIMMCFERAGDLSLIQLQQLETQTVSDGTTEDPALGPIIEIAIQQSPIVYIRNGDLSKGITRFRDLLQAVETRSTKALRQTLARQLAEVLLRGVCEKSYVSVDVNSKASTPGRGASNKSPLQPSQYRGSGLFVPKDENEESLLLLLISEAMATKEAILNRSPDLNDARKHTFHNATAVYDLLTIALVRRARFDMLADTFERAMKFSFDEFHIWYQFALSLICAEKFDRALLALKECLRLQPKNMQLLLQAAVLCYEHLHQLDQGLQYAQAAVEAEENLHLVARAHVALGIGYGMKGDEAKTQLDRQQLQKKALQLFRKAHSLDTNDHLPLFHLGLHYAILRQIPEATKYVRRSLRLRGDHVHSLHLMVLVLSAQKQYQEALELIQAAVNEYPGNFGLLITKCKLEETVYGVEEALVTCKHLLKLWKQVFEPKILNEQRGTGLIDKVTSDHRSLMQLHLAELSDRDSGSVRAESMAASRVEQALSEVASSLNSSFHPRTGMQQPWVIQTQIWLLLADLYLDLERIEEAHACVTEAGSIYPLSHQVSYMRGRILEYKREYDEAKSCYENATSINPCHIKSLQHLGMVQHYMDHSRMAEKVLRDAVNADPTSSQSWQCLGRVLYELQDFEAAVECLSTAVDLEATEPILPFTAITRTLH